MIKNRIVIKFFTMISFVVVSILIIQFTFQYFWMDDYYLYNKKNIIVRELYALEKIIKESSIKEIDESLMLFSQKNNAFIGISNPYGTLKYGFDYDNEYIKVKDENDNIYTVYVNLFIKQEDFKDKIRKNIEVQIKGNSSDEYNIYPIDIKLGDKTFTTNIKKDMIMINVTPAISMKSIALIPIEEQKDIDDLKSEIESKPAKQIIKYEDKKIKGTIIDYNFDENIYSGREYKKNQLLEEIYLFLQNEKNVNGFFENNKVVNYSKVDTFTGINNIVFAKPTFLDDKPMIIFAISSLQPMEETTQIIKQYFLLIFLISIILVIITAYFYSKKITKPILHLNEVTKSMSSLDFSNVCIVNSNDEIQDLSNNINILSQSLETSLNELKNANLQLQNDIKLKETMDISRKRFIADVSHELKTPLTIIKGICEGILDGVYDIDDKSNIDKILNKVLEMSELVYDLLEISKLETYNADLSKSVFQLEDIILKIKNDFACIITNKSIKVTTELLDCFVFGDERAIEQVIKNLYSNAVKYTSENGYIIIKMKVENNKCIFSIENCPAQIPKEDLLKVWEAFYVVHKSRNKFFAGSGLGLYIVKRILDNHNSNYDIFNTDNGVKITFDLDLICSDYDTFYQND